jgi:hypothetical protein
VSHVEDNDKGWKNILGLFSDAERYSMSVGVQSDAYDENGASIAQYAFYNEFGTDRIPARPFISTTSDQKKDSWWARFYEDIDFVNDKTPERAFNKLGPRASADIQRTITKLKDPPNKPGTVRKKKSSNPLIDTGAMRASIRHEVEKDV